MTQIKKRDGRIVNFDQNKIIDAIFAAFQSIDGELSDYAYIKAGNISDYIQERANEWNQENEYLTVEDIQDLVEKGLMSTKRKDVARAYITYRNERTAERNRNSNFMNRVREKLSASNVQNQNANVDESSFGGRKGEATNELLKQIALDYGMSTMARENHINNRIYIHDLDSYIIGMHNCLSLPLDDLLANGFDTRQTDVRPANSINTAFQLLAVLFQLQSLQQFGGVAATHLDWTMVPYVRKSFNKHFKDGVEFILDIQPSGWDVYKDKPIDSFEYKNYNRKVYKYALKQTEKELQQAVEGMYHNLK